MTHQVQNQESKARFKIKTSKRFILPKCYILCLRTSIKCVALFQQLQLFQSVTEESVSARFEFICDEPCHTTEHTRYQLSEAVRSAPVQKNAQTNTDATMREILSRSCTCTWTGRRENIFPVFRLSLGDLFIERFKQGIILGTCSAPALWAQVPSLIAKDRNELCPNYWFWPI